MSLNERKILILPFALENEELRTKADYLSRQIPVLLRNCFEKEQPGRVITSPIATEKDGRRSWVLHNQMWSDEAAARFARDRGFDIVVFGAIQGSADAGSDRTMLMRGLITEDRKVLIDKMVTGDIFRLAARALEGMAVYIPMMQKAAVALFEPQTTSAAAYEHYLAGLDVLLALRSEGMVLGRPDHALSPFEVALEICPEFDDAFTAELSCALQAAESSGAAMPTETVVEALEALIELRPDDPRPFAVLAEMLIFRENLPRALGYLERGLKTISPTNRDLLRRSGDILVELGQKDRAIEAYKACLVLEADDSLQERLASLHIMLARNDEALDLIQDLVQRRPGRIDMHARQALLLHRMGRKEAAWLSFAEMFRDGDGPTETELTKMNALLAGEVPSAAVVERLRAWYPPENFSGVRRLLFGKSLRLMGARFESGLCLRSVNEVDLDAENRGLLARERLNLLHEDFDQRFAALAQKIVNDGLTEGVELIEKAVEEEPRFWPARFLKGLVLSKRGDYEASISELELVLEIEPKNDVVWYTRGLQFVRLGRDDEAVRSFESALELNETETDYLSNLALSHARLNDVDAAYAALQKVESLRPDDPENERLRQSIQDSL